VLINYTQFYEDVKPF